MPMTVSLSFSAMSSATGFSRYWMATTPPAVVMVRSARPKWRLMGPWETSTWWILSMGTRVWLTTNTPLRISTLSESIL